VLTRRLIFRIGTNIEIIGLVLYNTEAIKEDLSSKKSYELSGKIAIFVLR
jgi:hypothetical protein